MKYTLMARSKPSEDVFCRFDRLVSYLESARDIVAFDASPLRLLKESGTDPSTIMSLSKCFPRGCKSMVNFQNRSYFRDEGKFDDFFDLEFNPRKLNYNRLVEDFFPGLIDAFQCYRGWIGNASFALSDFDKARGYDFRSSVFRVYPVTFLGESLCRNAYRLTPGEVVEILGEKDLVDNVSVASDGVMIVVSRIALEPEEADAKDRLIQEALKAKGSLGDEPL